jgi:hypothetical protein
LVESVVSKPGAVLKMAISAALQTRQREVVKKYLACRIGPFQPRPPPGLFVWLSSTEFHAIFAAAVFPLQFEQVEAGDRRDFGFKSLSSFRCLPGLSP